MSDISPCEILKHLIFVNSADFPRKLSAHEIQVFYSIPIHLGINLRKVMRPFPLMSTFLQGQGAVDLWGDHNFIITCAEPPRDRVCQISSHWHWLLKSYAETAHQRTGLVTKHIYLKYFHG